MSAYQKVVDLIRDTATAVSPNCCFVHGDQQKHFDAFVKNFYDENDRTAFRSPEPLIYLAPFTPRAAFNKRQFREQELFIAFMIQDTKDSTADEQEAILETASILCNDFIDALELVDGVTYTAYSEEPQYEQMVGIVTGWLLRITITIDVDVCQ